MDAVGWGGNMMMKPMMIISKLTISMCFYVAMPTHYSNVIMGAMASQITSLTIVFLTVYSDADQRKHQSSASLAFVQGIDRVSVNSPHKWPVTRKMFPLDDVIMNHCFDCTYGSQWLLRGMIWEAWFNIKMSPYQYRKSHCGDKTVVRSSFLHKGNSYTGKITSLYWIRVQLPAQPLQGL